MPSAQVVICNQLGLHARASAKLVDTANHFSAEVCLLTDTQQQANAKSIMGLMMLGAPCGTPIQLDATGEDAEQALQAIVTLINNRFGEDS